MILPGRKASAFRATLADIFIRVMGGDLSLAEEIKEISEFHDTRRSTLKHDGFCGLRAASRSRTIPSRNSETRASSLPETHPLYAFMVASAGIGRSSSWETRIQAETAARLEFNNRLQVAQGESRELAVKLRASEELANRLVVEVAGIRTAQRVEYNAEAFDDIQTLESFIASPPTTAVRFKDLFRFITIDYRKSQVPVMLRGIIEACEELHHRFTTEAGEGCICAKVRELKRVLGWIPMH